MRARAAVLCVLLGAALAAPAGAQLVDRRQGWNWTDKPLDPATQRRNVTYWIDPPPAGAAAGAVGAVEDAIAAWNASKNFPGGIRLSQAADCPGADIRISWGQRLPSWGSTAQRGGAGNKGQMQVTLETRDNGGWLNAQQIENIARHELGHCMGLNDNAASDCMKPQTTKAPLAGPDWPIGAADIAANRSLNFDFYDVVRPPFQGLASVTPLPFGFEYRYNVSLDPRAAHAVNVFNVTSLSSMRAVSLPPGWNAHYLDPITGKGGEHFAPGTMTCVAAPGFELAPGDRKVFVFSSPGRPENGWVSVADTNGEMAELGDVPQILTPGGPVVPGVDGRTLGMLALLLLAAGTTVLRFAARRAASS